MAQAGRDGNQVASALGSYNGGTVKLKADHTTGYLKIKITPATLAPPVVTSSLAGIDGNSVKTALGTYNGAPKALLGQNGTGYLRVILS
jgi:hypothetical protein